ncbi:1417_t:CDS:2, partial [Entrophospora sp. SA101]
GYLLKECGGSCSYNPCLFLALISKYYIRSKSQAGANQFSGNTFNNSIGGDNDGNNNDNKIELLKAYYYSDDGNSSTLPSNL